MATDFYTQWLLVVPGPRPPNHYALLGLPPFCTDVDEIEEGAHRQLERLDRYALHPDEQTRDACQRIMNEVARARMVLVSPEKRRAYDEELLGKTVAGSGSGAEPEIQPSALTRLATTQGYEPGVEVGIRGVAEPVEKERPVESRVPPVVADSRNVAEHAGHTEPQDVVASLASAAQAARLRGGGSKRKYPGRGLAVVLTALIVAGGLSYGGYQYLHQKPAPKGRQQVAVIPSPDDGRNTNGSAPQPPQRNHRDPNLVAIPLPRGNAAPGAGNEPATDFFGIPAIVGGTGNSGQPGRNRNNRVPATGPNVAVQPLNNKPPKHGNPPPPVVEVDEPKGPVPDAALLATAAKHVNELYGDDISSSKTREDMSVLGAKLLNTGLTTKGDVAGRYALFAKARDLAIQADNPGLTLQIINQIDKKYQIDAVAMRTDSFVNLIAAIHTPVDEQAVNKVAPQVIDDAINADRYDVARQLCEGALRAARDGNDTTAAQQIVVRLLQIRGAAPALAQAKNAAPTLAITPADPDANLAAGFYRCVWKGDWMTGLPMLAQCSDTGLATIANKELHAGVSADAVVAAGDDWWNYAENQPSVVRQRIRAHAAALYRQAVPALDGLSLEKVNRRLEVVGRMALAGTSPATVAVATPLGKPTLALGTAGSIVPRQLQRAGTLPIPDPQAQADAMVQVIHLLGRAANDTSPQGRGRLLGTLWKTSLANKHGDAGTASAAINYVLLRETVRLASETGDMQTIAGAADDLGQGFGVDVLDLKYQAMNHATVSDNLTFVDAAEELRDEALERREYNTAAKFAAYAEGLTRRMLDPTLMAAVHARNAVLADWPQVQIAMSTLDGKADDPDANLVLGKFLCFVGGDWSEGLKHLALCSDAQIKALAVAEIAKPSSAAQQKSLADGWWDVALVNLTMRVPIEYHAASWYAKASPDLSSQLQILANSRLLSLNRDKNVLPPVGSEPDDPRVPAATAKLQLTLPTGLGSGSFTVGFSADGKQIVALGSQQFLVWDSTTGTAAGPPTSLGDTPSIPQNRENFLAASGDRIVALGGNGETLAVWDIATRKQIGPTIAKNQMVDADLSPDGKFVVTANGDGPATASIWDMSTGLPVGSEMPHKGRITSVRYSMDGKYIVTSSMDRMCRVWSAVDGTLLSQFGPVKTTDWFSAATLDPSDKRLATLLHGGQTVLWDVATGRVLLDMNAVISGSVVEYSPNGQYLATAGMHQYHYSHAQNVWGGAQVFENATGIALTGLLKHEAGPSPASTEGAISLAFSRDSHYLVTASNVGKLVRVWDLPKGGILVVKPLEHPQGVTAAAFDATAHRVATACSDGSVRVWQLP